MKKSLLSIALITLSMNAFSTSDAQSNGSGWISLGKVKMFHMGTEGKLYINGTDQGQCGGVTPLYFRMDMQKPHFKEFFSWMLQMQEQKKSLDCVVDRGCGTDEVWVKYCRGGFE